MVGILNFLIFYYLKDIELNNFLENIMNVQLYQNLKIFLENLKDNQELNLEKNQFIFSKLQLLFWVFYFYFIFFNFLKILKSLVMRDHSSWLFFIKEILLNNLKNKIIGIYITKGFEIILGKLYNNKYMIIIIII